MKGRRKICIMAGLVNGLLRHGTSEAHALDAPADLEVLAVRLTPGRDLIEILVQSSEFQGGEDGTIDAAPPWMPAFRVGRRRPFPSTEVQS